MAACFPPANSIQRANDRACFYANDPFDPVIWPAGSSSFIAQQASHLRRLPRLPVALGIEHPIIFHFKTLSRRRLLSAECSGPTAVPEYSLHRTWV